MKVQGWKCGDEKAEDENAKDESVRMKVRGWKCEDEISEDEISKDEKSEDEKAEDENARMKLQGWSVTQPEKIVGRYFKTFSFGLGWPFIFMGFAYYNQRFFWPAKIIINT